MARAHLHMATSAQRVPVHLAGDMGRLQACSRCCQDGAWLRLPSGEPCQVTLDDEAVGVGQHLLAEAILGHAQALHGGDSEGRYSSVLACPSCQAGR